MDLLQSATENGVFVKWLSRDVPGLKLVGESNTIIGCFYSSWKTRHPALRDMIEAYGTIHGNTFYADVEHTNSQDYILYYFKQEVTQPLHYMKAGIIKRQLAFDLTRVKDTETWLLQDIKYQIGADEGMMWRLMLPIRDKDDKQAIFVIDRPLEQKAITPTEALMTAETV